MPEGRRYNLTEAARTRAAAQRVSRPDYADAFIPDPGDGPVTMPDDLAEDLAEEYVRSATTGQDADDRVLERFDSEEMGGPFIETGPEDEFASEPDPSMPSDAEPEALPRAIHALSQPPLETSDQAEDADDDLDTTSGDEERLRGEADPR